MWLNSASSRRRSSFQYGPNADSEVTIRTELDERLVAVGALVDMLDRKAGPARFVATLGGGVIPYSRSAYYYAQSAQPVSEDRNVRTGQGGHLVAGLGVRWKWLTLDQQLHVRIGDVISADRGAVFPITMGVRF